MCTHYRQPNRIILPGQPANHKLITICWNLEWGTYDVSYLQILTCEVTVSTAGSVPFDKQIYVYSKVQKQILAQVHKGKYASSCVSSLLPQVLAQVCQCLRKSIHKHASAHVRKYLRKCKVNKYLRKYASIQVQKCQSTQVHAQVCNCASTQVLAQVCECLRKCKYLPICGREIFQMLHYKIKIIVVIPANTKCRSNVGPVSHTVIQY